MSDQTVLRSKMCSLGIHRSNMTRAISYDLLYEVWEVVCLVSGKETEGNLKKIFKQTICS